jgi:AraC-like DNA-binding protein
MTEHKYYLRQDLTLHELASLLGTNTLYISRIINARTGHNFNSFINQYRIEEACKILVADQQQLMSIEGIALTCGFKSKSAFNAAFKKLKGVTPTEYIEKQKLAI